MDEKFKQKFGFLTEELVTLRGLIESAGVEECAIESTGIYRTPVWLAKRLS